MGELQDMSPLQGQRPLELPEVTICEVAMRKLTVVAPFAGQDGALARGMEAEFGLDLPKPGGVSINGTVQSRWFGHGQWVVVGAEVPTNWTDFALVTDQSDGWGALNVTGDSAERVLARLIPVDLAAEAFPTGSTARTMCGHMAVSVTRLAENEFEIMGFRSMAQSLFEELSRAAGLVAARARLP